MFVRLFGNLFNREIREISSPPKGGTASFWADRVYDRNNVPMFIAFLEMIYKKHAAARNDPELLVYYASFVCGVAVNMRVHSEVDLHTLRFPIQPPSLASSLLAGFDGVDGVIESILDFTGKARPDDPRRPDAWAMLQALFIWKGYLSALTTSPASWGDISLRCSER